MWIYYYATFNCLFCRLNSLILWTFLKCRSLFNCLIAIFVYFLWRVSKLFSPFLRFHHLSYALCPRTKGSAGRCARFGCKCLLPAHVIDSTNKINIFNNTATTYGLWFRRKERHRRGRGLLSCFTYFWWGLWSFAKPLLILLIWRFVTDF